MRIIAKFGARSQPFASPPRVGSIIIDNVAGGRVCSSQSNLTGSQEQVNDVSAAGEQQVDNCMVSDSAPPSRRERRRTETRDRLFRAAMALLAERDFDSVTVEAITEAADVGKGTFFNYFANKEAVVGYAFEAQHKFMTEMLESAEIEREALRGPDTDGEAEYGQTFRKLMWVVRQVEERRNPNKRVTRTLLSLALTNPAVRVAHLEVRHRFLSTVQELVREAQESGELRAEFGEEQLAAHLCLVHLSALFAWAQGDDVVSLHDAFETAYKLVWRGIGCTVGRSVPDATV